MNSPLSPTAPSEWSCALCQEIRLITAHLGRAPSVAELEKWAGLSENAGPYYTTGLVTQGLAVKDRVTGRRKTFVSLTAAGVAAAERCLAGFDDAPRAGGRASAAKPATPLVDNFPRTSRLYAPGYQRSSREVICELETEVMTRCLLCGYEAAIRKARWVTCPRACDWCSDKTVPEEQVTAWLADVPDEAAPTPEERAEMLDLVLEEIGKAPLLERERFTTALAYTDMYAPGQTFTLEQVSLVLGVTRERVRQIERNALDALRARLRRSGEAADIIESLREIDAHRVGEE